MIVKDAMHKGVESATPATSLAEIAEIMTKHDVGAVPIVGEQGLVGIVTDRDIACRAFAKDKQAARLTAGDVMSADPVFCREGESIDDAVHLMEDKQVRRLPVLDDRDRLVGMLSLGDVAHTTSRDMTGEMVRAVSAHHEEPQLLRSGS